MWPPDTSTDVQEGRRRAEATFRTLLFFACLLAGILVARGQGVAAGGDAAALRERDVRRAEKVLEKLGRLDAAAAAREDGGDFRRVARKLYPGLFVAVADMRPSDLKTDLDTAVFLYEDAARTWSAAGNSVADCEGQRPDLYLALCRGLRGGTARQLLLAKARLHALWAEAVVKTYSGEGDGETARLVSEMRAARARDHVIAARVSEALKSLEAFVNVYPSYADYQEQRGEAKVRFERLEAEFADALGRGRALLGWLPRSPAHYQLSSAWRSYADGLFWYEKVHRSRKKVVSAAAGFERDPLEDLRLGADHVGYTVVVNWKAAARYTHLAQQSLSSPPVEK